MVCLAGLGAHLGEQLDQLAEVVRSAAGQEPLLDSLAVCKQTNAVARIERKLRQRQLTEDGNIEISAGLALGARWDLCRPPGNVSNRPRIAVGMPIAGHPPHRSGRAQFEHPAPTLGV